MIDCSRCGVRLASPVASITLDVMGDECDESFYLCTSCDVYTGHILQDRFLGNTTEHRRGPIPRPDGDRIVAAILKCPDSGGKHCDCPAHRRA